MKYSILSGAATLLIGRMDKIAQTGNTSTFNSIEKGNYCTLFTYIRVRMKSK